MGFVLRIFENLEVSKQKIWKMGVPVRNHVSLFRDCDFFMPIYTEGTASKLVCWWSRSTSSSKPFCRQCVFADRQTMQDLLECFSVLRGCGVVLREQGGVILNAFCLRCEFSEG